MSLLDVIDRVAAHKPRSFIAPLPDAERVEVFTHIDNIPYQFRLRNSEPGWWLLSPISGQRVTKDRPAYPHEYIRYLEALPRFYVIACFRLAEMTWLVVPFNASDAAQRGWSQGEPRPLHLITQGIVPLDVLDARDLAGMLLFNAVSNKLGVRRDMHGQVIIDWLDKNFFNAYHILEARREEQRQRAIEARKQIAREAAQRAVEERQQTVEGQIEFELGFVGAELVDWSEVGDGYAVTWEYEGYQHTATVKRDMRLQSAGICLGHRADDYEWQTLATLVQTIQEGRRLKRFDLPEEAYL